MTTLEICLSISTGLLLVAGIFFMVLIVRMSEYNENVMNWANHADDILVRLYENTIGIKPFVEQLKEIPHIADDDLGKTQKFILDSSIMLESYMIEMQAKE